MNKKNSYNLLKKLKWEIVIQKLLKQAKLRTWRLIPTKRAKLFHSRHNKWPSQRHRASRPQRLSSWAMQTLAKPPSSTLSWMATHSEVRKRRPPKLCRTSPRWLKPVIHKGRNTSCDWSFGTLQAILRPIILLTCSSRMLK